MTTNHRTIPEKTPAPAGTPENGTLSPAVLTRTTILKDTAFTAEDVIAGFREVPGFVFAYAVPPRPGLDANVEVIAIFATAPGELRPGQREVLIPAVP